MLRQIRIRAVELRKRRPAEPAQSGGVLRRVGAHAGRTRGKPARWNALALASSSVAVCDDKHADRGDAGHGA